MSTRLKIKCLRILLELSLLREILSETYTLYTLNNVHNLGSISTYRGAKTSWVSYRKISTREGRTLFNARDCKYRDWVILWQTFYPSRDLMNAAPSRVPKRILVIFSLMPTYGILPGTKPSVPILPPLPFP